MVTIVAAFLLTLKRHLILWIKVYIYKLEHFVIRGISNKWFAYYLSNRKQFATINEFNSNLPETRCGLPQGSILGPSL